MLAYLASTRQGGEPARDAEPGKILHETRKGRWRRCTKFLSGSITGASIPLHCFVMLAGAYYERTADLAFIQTIWPNLEAGLTWMDTFGDPDRDGFVEYVRSLPPGWTIRDGKTFDRFDFACGWITG